MRLCFITVPLEVLQNDFSWLRNSAVLQGYVGFSRRRRNVIQIHRQMMFDISACQQGLIPLKRRLAPDFSRLSCKSSRAQSIDVMGKLNVFGSDLAIEPEQTLRGT